MLSSVALVLRSAKRGDVVCRLVFCGSMALAGVARAGGPIVEDVAVCLNFQGPRGAGATDFFMGRLLLAGDLDRDGRLDLVLGNPGDPSFVARLVESTSVECPFELEVVQVLSTDRVYWSGGLADLDNDGDLDLFIGGGGNENAEHDVYWKNLWVESGSLVFEDVTASAATVVDEFGNTVAVSIARHSWDADLDGNGVPGDELLATSGVAFADVDNDGWLDIFLSGNLGTPGPDGCSEPACARNTLWLNNGDGTFRDATVSAGLQGRGNRTRHASFFDYDDDGSMDLLVNNYLGYNDVYRNLTGELGELRFENVNDDIVAAGEDVRFPWDSFGSRAFDVNHDGKEDFMLATHAPRATFTDEEGRDWSYWIDCGGAEVVDVGIVEANPEALATSRPIGPGTNSRPDPSPYPVGEHALFVSGPDGYVNRATELGINAKLFSQGGVMGWQTGDVNADGIVDIVMGNGAPASGQEMYLLLSDPRQPWGTVLYEDRSDLLNWLDVPRDPTVDESLYDRWPDGTRLRFRGHGTVIADIDEDGTLEILSSNGGTKYVGDFGDVREPNRAYKLSWPTPRQFLKVRLEGDGIHVNRDAIGASVTLTITDSTGTRSLFGRVSAPHAFSAQNPLELYFGLGAESEVVVDSLVVRWPDGSEVTLDDGVTPNTVVHVTYGGPESPAATRDQTGRSDRTLR